MNFIYAKANHPKTVLNPDDYFLVTESKAEGSKLYVRGSNTCWFESTGVEFFNQKQAQQLIEEAKQLQKEREQSVITPEMLKDGVIIYAVHGLGRSSFLQTWKIVGEPYRSNSPSDLGLFCKYQDVREGEIASYVSEFSLQDMNIITNSYNYHRCFLSKRKAEAYNEMCKTKTIR